MTKAELHKVEVGSRMQLLAWYSYTGLLWGLKACMLCFFYRLTAGLELQKYVKLLAYTCGFSYLAVFITLSVGCYPIQKNWQLTPNPGLQCSVSHCTKNHYIPAREHQRLRELSSEPRTST
jgi:hypothetical protein